jgi:predicted XRE-type DNA-binding protein
MGKKISYESDRQQESRTLPLFDGRQPERPEVSHDFIVTRSSMRKAIQLAIDVCGLEDKQIAGSLGIDVAQWSRIKTGNAWFPQDRLVEFMKLVGNDIPLIWLAHQRGYELRPLRSALERENLELRERVAQLERDQETIVEFVQRTGVRK